MFSQSLLFCLTSYAFFYKRKRGYKIGTYITKVGLTLGAINMRVEQGKKVKMRGEIHITY